MCQGQEKDNLREGRELGGWSVDEECLTKCPNSHPACVRARRCCVSRHLKGVQTTKWVVIIKHSFLLLHTNTILCTYNC